jgi:hypothetical protein
MPYNILATCGIGRIMSRRVQPGRAVKQAREYRRRGFTDIRIVDVETQEEFEVAALAERLQGGEPKPA